MEDTPDNSKRLSFEIKYLLENPVEGITLEFPELNRWTGTIIGTKNTRYQDLDFKFEINFDDRYPFSPPVFKFTTLMWHPNVFFGDPLEQGRLFIDMLDKAWTPAYHMFSVLEYIKTIFGHPELSDPVHPFCLTEDDIADRYPIFELWQQSQEIEFKEKYKNINFEEKFINELSPEDFEALKKKKKNLI